MSDFKHQEKVRHIRKGDVAFTVVSKKLSEKQVEYTVAYCSPKDQFVKKEGIRVAQNSDTRYTVEISEGSTFKDINFAILVNMIKHRADAPRAHYDYLNSLFVDMTEY